MVSPSTTLRPGFATPEGTRRYAERFRPRAAAGHFRPLPDASAQRKAEGKGLLVSSIGIGTYLGDPDAATDRGYTDAVVAAVQGGINFIDSAINYRFQRSERSIRAALDKLEAAGYRRDELVLCTKGGFLTPDADLPADPGEYFHHEYVEGGIFRMEDVAAESHCIAPKFVENQLERSRHNLGIECIDVYYLHNPETQLSAVTREEFRRRLRAAFESLESAAAAGRIRWYGLATWNGFRQPEQAADYLSLAEALAAAREAGGEDHHFRFVQMPFNLAMTEALTLGNQLWSGQRVPMVEAARALGITLVASASLLQGHLGRNLPEHVRQVLGLNSDLECALQFARSAAGVTTALVGMSRAAHVAADLRLVGVEPASFEQFRQLFRPRNPA